MSDLKDFVIENGVLTKYVGQGGDVVIPDGVTSIGDDAFNKCKSLTSIVIPDSVTTIGSNAFRSCKGLTDIEIPDGVTGIGDLAFYECDKLVEVVNKSTHITVEKGSALNGGVGCYALAVYNSGDTFVTKLTNDNGYIVYTDGEERILVGYMGTETDLIFPSYITKIHQYAFYNCSCLTNVEISENVTSIGNWAFNYCSSLKKVVIGDNVKSIGEGAFSSCTRLAKVVIGKNVRNIGGCAFQHCNKLKSIYIKDIAAWCNISFADSYLKPFSFARDLYLNNKLITELVIPDGVTDIRDFTFSFCSSLTKVVIPDSVTSIGVSAFEGCSSLTKVVMGDSVTSIGASAFEGCSSLTRLKVSANIKEMGNWPFGDIEELLIPESVVAVIAQKEACFGEHGGARYLFILRGGKEPLRTVGVFRRMYWKQSFDCKEEFLAPYRECDISNYDTLLAVGNFEGFKIAEAWRIRAIGLRLQQVEFPINEDFKEIFIEFLKDKFNNLIKIANEEKDPTLIKAAIEAGCVTEENKKKVTNALKKSEMDEIKELVNLL